MLPLRRRTGFTLIELLVVVAIIALLISILLPSLAAARSVSRRSACGAQLRGIGSALATYAGYNDGILPYNALAGNGGTFGPGGVYNPGSSWTGQNTLVYRENCWHNNNGPSSGTPHPFDIVMGEYMGGTASKLYVCPGAGSTHPAFLADAALGTQWFNVATGKPFSGASTKRFRSSYTWFTNDLGNYARDQATKQVYYTDSAAFIGRYYQDLALTKPFEGFNYFRRRFDRLPPGSVLVQDTTALDGSVGNLIYTNHPTGNAGQTSAMIVPGSNPTATPAYSVVDHPSRSGANSLFSDGSVQWSISSRVSRVHSPIFFGNVPESSIYVDMPLTANPAQQ